MPEVYTADHGKTEVPPTAAAAELPDPSGGIFSSFISQPTWADFDTREPAERIILLLRPHRVTNVSWVITAVVMMVAPSVLSVFPILSFLPARFQAAGIIFWYLLTSAFIFESFLHWFYNIFIVTDRRVIDVDFYSLMYREISEAHLTQIEDVTLKQGGFVRAMFNYGSVFIQTAAEVENIQFEDVPDPARVTKVIDSLIPERT